jgi:hypothetical protein
MILRGWPQLSVDCQSLAQSKALSLDFLPTERSLASAFRRSYLTGRSGLGIIAGKTFALKHKGN